MRRLLMTLALACAPLTFAPLPAAAKDQLNFDPDVILDCIEGGGWHDCVGAATEACVEASPGEGSLRVRALCAGREQAAWEAGLDELLAEIAARDDYVDEAVGVDPEAGPRAQLLDGLHRAWLEYRELSCRYEGLRWGTPSEVAAAEAGCRMILTGEHVLTLRSYAAEG